MNRIIITARSAKGLTEIEVAQEFKIDENLYKEIELGISPTTSEMAETFESLYNVPAYYFTTFYSENIQTSIEALEKLKEILTGTPDIQNISVPARTHLSIAKMGWDAIIANMNKFFY